MPISPPIYEQHDKKLFLTEKILTLSNRNSRNKNKFMIENRYFIKTNMFELI